MTRHWQAAWGGPAGRARLKTEPADFRVDEVLGFEPDGRGEHVLLWIRKQGANTDEVAQALARFARVPGRCVGTSGKKDRNADTGQWFSVQLAGRNEPDWRDFNEERWRVERAERHGRKLRTGTHRGNRFTLCLRGFRGDRAAVDERLQRIAAAGFPNYFGPQRFGRDGDNLRRARALLAGELQCRRTARGLYLSAARSWLFNRILDQRVGDDTWCSPLPGDALMLAGTRSMFTCRGDEPDLAERIAALDVHVTGPLWGTGQPPVSPERLAAERTLLADEAALLTGLEATGMRADRRALRATAGAFARTWTDDVLELSFVLEAGSFATSLLFELVEVDP